MQGRAQKTGLGKHTTDTGRGGGGGLGCKLAARLDRERGDSTTGFPSSEKIRSLTKARMEFRTGKGNCSLKSGLYVNPRGVKKQNRDTQLKRGTRLSNERIRKKSIRSKMLPGRLVKAKCKHISEGKLSRKDKKSIK